MTDKQTTVIKVKFKPIFWRENYKIEEEIRGYIFSRNQGTNDKDKIIRILYRRPELIVEIESCSDMLIFVLSLPQALMDVCSSRKA